MTTQTDTGLIIDRTHPFNPVAFTGLGQGWSIAEEDKRALQLTRIALANTRFETTLKPGELVIFGEERLTRLKAMSDIRLDAKVSQTLWENQHLIPEHWKNETNGNTSCIVFDGTILLSSRDKRCVLYLYWDVRGWHWGHGWLDDGWYSSYLSVLSASE